MALRGPEIPNHHERQFMQPLAGIYHAFNAHFRRRSQKVGSKNR